MPFPNAYLWLKALHVLTAAIWLGSLVTFVELDARAIRSGSRAAVETFADQSRFIGMRIAGPAAILSLLAGIGGMVVGHVGMTAWIWVGIVAMALFVLTGVTVVRATSGKLAAAVRATGTSQAELATRMARLRRWNMINIVILAAAVVAMVLKP